MEQPGRQQGDGSPAQRQAGDLPRPSQQEVEVVEVEDDNPGTMLTKEAKAYLSKANQEIRNSELFCEDMQAAVNELSQYDGKLYLDVTQAWDLIKEYQKAARNQSWIYIYSQRHSCHRTRYHIQKMTEQLCIFRAHRNRITDLYLAQLPLPQNPDAQRLRDHLGRHMSLLREDVKRLLQMAKGEPPVDGNQAGAAGQAVGPSQPAARQG
ncbi:hypothetical protein KVR01_001304 [Diaporthe batatas]|uniref:uncharacterized protein n=1 Tax=Diaporthe batatas TaxID=748121 RepID=UPI001D04A070|nr:uncharacterized protein KVR01_001304 [Diaporthe batatas]KAG8168555.1 hypothetical protein KVR01_001304 [Diaporthe batatas]